MSSKIKVMPSHFTATELAQYLQKLGLESTALEPTLDTLTKVLRKHLVIFPFENLGMHYSESHIVDVSLPSLFQRMVVEEKGGSWCSGHNGFIMEMLRAIGFRAYVCGARLSLAPVRESQVHSVVLVVPSDTNGATYLIDLGLGLYGPVWPIRLRHEEAVQGASGGEAHRLVHARHPDSVIKEGADGAVGDRGDDLAPWSQYWAVEMRLAEDKPWKRVCYFTPAAEIFPEDLQDMSLVVSMRQTGLLWSNVFVIRFFEVEGEKEMGRLILHHNEVKKRGVGNMEVEDVEQLGTEEQRVAALKKYFGIELTEAEVKSIHGRKAALPSA
ncbi:hypothetical protein BOTBODRAFT_180196 [Botryobasidium botryosum FD-172 SS1]|uniref:Uncharacterized protein n=1 Tax=Botryobasidium botryosum (strain FD-172 SS1) TaxID=930990 RepID=A0A067M054_BOTB1|nr:hypothetical protein BOTBODRAFT_180196 [Botryobasidium botryosum FD-172 SS1]